MASIVNHSFQISTPFCPLSEHAVRKLPPTCFTPSNYQLRSKHGGALIKASAVTPNRRSGNYPANLWKHDYVQTLHNNHMEEEKHKKRHKELKEEVRQMVEQEKDMVELVRLVDCLQQLGLGCHFEKEIGDALRTISDDSDAIIGKEGLHLTALLFRVLRENGFHISPDVFEKFLDGNGEFGEVCLTHGAQAILSLYEASFYAFPDETLLDKARNFTTNYLNETMSTSNSVPDNLKSKMAHALDLPINLKMPRLQARIFIDSYSQEANMNVSVLELAKLDFNMVQHSHKLELREAARWCKNSNKSEKLPFTRDRIVEAFFWAVGMIPEAGYGDFRVKMAQLIYCHTVIDDIYDVYGSIDELELLTEAINKWDVNAMEPLPAYMKLSFLSLLNHTHDIAYNVLKQKELDITPFLKKSHQDICNSNMLEAEWYHNKHIPSLEEYLDNGKFSVCAPCMMIHTYILVDEDIKVETLKYLQEMPEIINLVSIVNRLNNDLGTAEHEAKRGDCHKSLHCYMHHANATEEEAREEKQKLIIELWKKINMERIEACKTLPKQLVDAAINLSRSFHCFYRHGDGYGSPEKYKIKEKIMMLLIEPVSI